MTREQQEDIESSNLFAEATKAMKRTKFGMSFDFIWKILVLCGFTAMLWLNNNYVSRADYKADSKLLADAVEKREASRTLADEKRDELLKDINATLTRMGAQVDVNRRIEKIADDHEQRIRSLEVFKR